jgi:uncharacterized protein YbjT (DUF2867 family)
MTGKKAIVAGATGLVGELLTDLLLRNKDYEEVVVLVRNSTGKKHPKLREIVCDFENIAHLHEQISADTAFCALGTTIAKAGTKEAFFRVDYDYVVNFARECSLSGVKHFLVVSALGADASSLIFYNRVKGKTEDALKLMGFEQLSILRPSLLLGKRKEMRFGEDAGKMFNAAFRFFIPERYKGIEARQVAYSMLKIAQTGNTPGVHFYESEMLRKII